MRFNKEKWENKVLGDVCDFINGRTFKMHELLDKGTPVLRVGNFFSNEKFYYSDLKLEEKSYCNPGDLLYAWSASFGPKIWNGPRAIFHTHIWRVELKNNILKEFLFTYLDKETDAIKKKAHGTTMLHITKATMLKFPIPLPPLSEQKQIAALFQSLDNAIEQVQKQEGKLKELRKNLINKLSKKNPWFGDAIKPESCKEYSIGEIATERKDRTDNPSTSGFDKFIGLEDFETGELFIQKFSSTKKLVSAMRLCKKGDVLFARRNAYLKRASLTKFDAVCSGDVIVMEVNPKIILPEFLILVMNTDAFWDFAIANAAGTMSKRVKWRDLATYSFDLPDIETQAKILKVFNQLEGALTQLKNHKETLKLLKQKLLNEILG